MASRLRSVVGAVLVSSILAARNDLLAFRTATGSASLGRIVLVPDRDRGYLFVTNTARHGREAAAEAIQALAAVTLPEQAVAD